MQKNWHAISLAEVFFETKSRKEGLTGSETNQKIKEFGRNILPKEKPPPSVSTKRTKPISRFWL